MAYTPSPTIISGGTGTGNVQSARRPLDISDRIAEYEPNANPFFLLAQKSSKMAVTDPEFKCLEAQIQPYLDAVNNAGGYTSTQTSIIVDNGSYFKANDLVLNTRTGEIFFVSSVSSNTLTVLRGYGSTAAAAMNNNDELRRLANAFEEGAAADTAKTIKVDAIQNYCRKAALVSDNKMKSCPNAGTPLELQLLIAEAEAIANSKNVEDLAISR